MTDFAPLAADEGRPEAPGREASDATPSGGNAVALQLLESLNIRRVELELAEQQLRAECESLAAQRDRYRSLFDSLPLPAVVMDANGSLCGANDLALTLLGIGEADVIRGRRLCSKLHASCQDDMVRGLGGRARTAGA